MYGEHLSALSATESGLSKESDVFVRNCLRQMSPNMDLLDPTLDLTIKKPAY